MGELSSIDTTRLGPYKNYRFLVYFDDISFPVAGMSQASGQPSSAGSMEQNQSEDPPTSRKSPGRSEYESVALERGVTYDSEFAQWAGQVWAAQITEPGNRSAPRGVICRNIRIVRLNEAAQPAGQYFGRNCWVSEYQAFPDLDAGASAVTIQHMKLESEGWIIAEPQQS